MGNGQDNGSNDSGNESNGNGGDFSEHHKPPYPIPEAGDTENEGEIKNE